MRNMIGGFALGLIVAGGVAGGLHAVQGLRQAEGRMIAGRAVYATEAQLARWNEDDGMKADRPFSFDDYCGRQCRPDSLYWGACVDACEDLGADSAGERE